MKTEVLFPQQNVRRFHISIKMLFGVYIRETLLGFSKRFYGVGDNFD